MAVKPQKVMVNLNMDNEKIYDIISRVLLIIAPLMGLVHALFFKEALWLVQLMGLLFLGWAVLNAIRKYRKGNRKLYFYISDALIIAGSVYIIIMP